MEPVDITSIQNGTECGGCGSVDVCFDECTWRWAHFDKEVDKVVDYFDCRNDTVNGLLASDTSNMYMSTAESDKHGIIIIMNHKMYVVLETHGLIETDSKVVIIPDDRTSQWTFNTAMKDARDRQIAILMDRNKLHLDNPEHGLAIKSYLVNAEALEKLNKI